MKNEIRIRCFHCNGTGSIIYMLKQPRHSEAIKELLKKRIKQVDIAKILGISRQRVNEIIKKEGSSSPREE